MYLTRQEPEITRAHCTPSSSLSLLPACCHIYLTPCRTSPPPPPSSTRGQDLTGDSKDAKILKERNSWQVTMPSSPFGTSTSYASAITAARKKLMISSPRQHLWSGTRSAGNRHPHALKWGSEGICVPLFNPNCHGVRTGRKRKELVTVASQERT